MSRLLILMYQLDVYGVVVVEVLYGVVEKKIQVRVDEGLSDGCDVL